jgi:RNA polymerase sigma-70 factor (ECF subfamily)
MARIRDAGNHEAWSEFVAWVGRIVGRFLRRRRLTESDALDVLQDVLLQLSVWARTHTHDPARGRFRSFLHSVARSRLIDFYRRQQRRGALTVGEVESLVRHDTAADFDEAYAAEVLRQAAELARPRFRERTYLAFWLTYVEGLSVAEAAARLGATPAAVNTARSRVKECVEGIIRDAGIA